MCCVVYADAATERRGCILRYSACSMLQHAVAVSTTYCYFTWGTWSVDLLAYDLPSDDWQPQIRSPVWILSREVGNPEWQNCAAPKAGPPPSTASVLVPPAVRRLLLWFSGFTSRHLPCPVSRVVFRLSCFMVSSCFFVAQFRLVYCEY